MACCWVVRSSASVRPARSRALRLSSIRMSSGLEGFMGRLRESGGGATHQLRQGQARGRDVGTLVDGLTQETFNAGMARHGLVQLHIMAGAVGAHADQVAVALVQREQLLEVLCL